MILEIGICVFLAGSLVLALVVGLPAFIERPDPSGAGHDTLIADEERLPLQNRLRRQKAFTVQEAEVWITCVQKVKALDAPKYTPARR